MRLSRLYFPAFLFVGSFVGSAFATGTWTAGVQTALPIVRPAPGVYTFPIFAVPSPGTPPVIHEIILGQDDTSPLAEFTVSVQAAYWPVPFNGAGAYNFTYRPELSPLQVPLPAAPASNVDPMSHWVACAAFSDAMKDCRALFNAAPTPPIAPAFMLLIDPATAAAYGGVVAPPPIGAGLYANEFYKYAIWR